MLFQLTANTVERETMVVFESHKSGDPSWQQIEWSREAETKAIEEKMGFARFGAYNPPRFRLKTFPHALYQWSTIDLNNQLKNPLTRDLMIPCNKLALNDDFEL